ncbi:speriolin-like [Vombatus ursinus]|uniref:speriolin-like n=1 Tax=Vombatus ursinus TaxID=29139 RepID=UPI000FFDA3E5|nr:speriolin-like [Vombatus ursinus]
MPPTSLGRRPRPPGRCHSSTVSPPIPRTMSLLSNYEGLRHQIERLVRENEELKKLVRLIRENHELKSAIKTQASTMGISGINSMFSEGVTSHASRTSDHKSGQKSEAEIGRSHTKEAYVGVFPPAAPVSTQNPASDDLGILTSLAEILNNSQSSPSTSISTGPASSPLTGPLPHPPPHPPNNTIPGRVAVLPNTPLFSFLTSNLNNQLADSIATSPNSLLANALPYSTPAPLSSPAIASETVPLVASTNGSLSSGPLSGSINNAQIVSPMTSPTKSPLMGPSPPAASVGSPQTGSMAVPPVSMLSSSLPGSLSAPMAVPPISTPSSSLTGSLSAPMAVPPINMLPSSLPGSLGAPMAIPPINTLLSSLPGSLGAPMAVPPTTALSGTIGSVGSPSGNVLPNSMVNNMLLIGPDQPLDATHHSSSSPPPSANIPVSSATIPKGNRWGGVGGVPGKND